MMLQEKSEIKSIGIVEKQQNIKNYQPLLERHTGAREGVWHKSKKCVYCKQQFEGEMEGINVKGEIMKNSWWH